MVLTLVFIYNIYKDININLNKMNFDSLKTQMMTMITMGKNDDYSLIYNMVYTYEKIQLINILKQYKNYITN